MIQFYAPEIENQPFLPEEESGHCCRVLRKKAGDIIRVTDGRGNAFECEIINPHPKHTEIRILKKQKYAPRQYHLTLAVAPTKNADRMEWLVEKAMEIGVDRIVLLDCRRSERKKLRTDRLQRILISAMNQSLDTRLPEIVEMMSLPVFLKEIHREESQKFFGYCSERFPRKDFSRECGKGGKVAVMIGPEGDFTEDEVKMAVENGFVPVTFGEKRLRTETAGLYAVCAVSLINQL